MMPISILYPYTGIDIICPIVRMVFDSIIHFLVIPIYRFAVFYIITFT